MQSLLRYVVFALIFYKNVAANESNPDPVNIITINIIPAQPKPDKFANEEGCYFPKFDRMLEVNVPFSPKNHKDGSTCERYTCKDNGQINIDKCSSRVKTDNCKTMPVDLSQAYPDCCEKALCTLPNGTVIEVY